MSRIRSMGGTMDIDTIRDNGTCIYFELDIADLKPNPQKAVL
jgi:hypothetical protein